MNHSKDYVKNILTLHKNYVKCGYQMKKTAQIWEVFIEEAKEFTAEDIDRETSRKFTKRFKAQPKCCFFNSLKIAKKLEGYRYFEGFATCMIPCEHAWIVSPEGKVIDVTWQRFFDEENAPQDYYGVEIPWKEAMENRKKDVWQPAWVEFLMKGSPVYE